MSKSDPVAEIEVAILTLFRRANDPRGNRQIYEAAGTDLERAGSVMLGRIQELEPARLSDVAAAAGVDLSTASRQVARLVDQGYVERSPDPHDGRAVLHRLTPEGRELRARLHRAIRDWFEQCLTDFSDAEQVQLSELLGRFVTRLGEMSDPKPVGAAATEPVT